ncbi:MAG: glycosyl transferase, partial [Gemmatimonadetes bacterium]|nr:glycosyl transferase [Gemmatimonadota bacterium]
MNSGRAAENPLQLEEPGPAGCGLLSNGRYAVAVTSHGCGFSTFDGFLLSAWRPDPVEGNCGFLVYLRDLESRAFWLASGRPVPGQAMGRVVRDPAGISILRQHEGLSSRVDVRLHLVDGIEQRSCLLVNPGPAPRRIEITSFIEVALNVPAAHEAHPAFSKLFVQTSTLGADSWLVAARRPRERGATAPVLVHALFDAPVSDFSTDRPAFIGRGRDPGCPRALADCSALERAHGNVLDPALCLRTVLQIEPGASRAVRFVLAAGDTVADLLPRLEELRNCALGSSAQLSGDGQSKFARDQLGGAEFRATAVAPRAARRRWARARAGRPAPPLKFFNGYGGFSQDGREYVLRLGSDAAGRPRLPPAPWINVIANADFGFFISESGAGTLWSGNSRERRLTPWSNDPVSDPHGDAIYVRDESTGDFWSPMPGPAAMSADFEVRHGFGYSTWQHCVDDLAHEVTVFVPETGALRLARLRIRNEGTRPRRLAVYAYNRWVLGATPAAGRSQVRADFSADLQAVLARDPSVERAPLAFAAANRARLGGWCASRPAFLGAPGSTAAPVALASDGALAEVCDADSCAVLRVNLDIAPG